MTSPPENAPSKKESGIVIVKHGALVLAATNRRYGGLSLPGGKYEDRDRAVIHTAARELAEETGYGVRPYDLVPVAKGKSATSDRIVTVYWARVVSGILGSVEENTMPLFTTWNDLLNRSPFASYYKEHFPCGVRHLADTNIGEFT